MTRKRKILTFCATQVAMIALALGFGGNHQAKGPYAQLFQNTFGVKDAEAIGTNCGEVCIDWGPWWTQYCSVAQAKYDDWCEYDIFTAGCNGGSSKELCGYRDGGDHDNDDSS